MGKYQNNNEGNYQPQNQNQNQMNEMTMDPQTSARWIAFYKAKAQKMKNWVIGLAVGFRANA